MPIINALPNTIANGQLEDAVPLMANFNWILSQVNGNACPATTGSGILKGNGTGGTITAVGGTDYPGLGSTNTFSGSNTFSSPVVGTASTLGTQYPLTSQVQANAFNSAAAGGTADAITAVFAPVPASVSAGQTFFVRAAAANATTTPTFTPNNGVIAPVTIVKGSNQALIAGDIPGAGAWIMLTWDATLSKWVLGNPAAPVGIPAATETVAGISRRATTAEAQAGTEDTAYLTALKGAQEILAQFNGAGKQSLTANGYQKFPGGFIVQWGTGANVASGASQLITFPIAFTTLCAAVTVMPRANTSVAASQNFVSIVNLTDFTWINQNAGTIYAMWIAVGW